MLNFIKAIFQNKALLWTLTKNDFKQKYFGNILGVAWAFILPAATIGILWFVFQVGFKSQPIDNFPFILWLVAGMFPWFYFSEGLSNGTNSIVANGFLVKKVVFRISLLPIVSISTALVVHLFFIVFMFGMFIYYGYSPEIYWIQILYYLFATSILLLGLSWLTSSIVVFFKDIGQFVAMVIQFGFWLTPIFWSLKMVPEEYHWFIKANPIHYIVKGYRDSMINQTWFWEDVTLMVYFWVVTLSIFILGGLTFKKLKPHFADVL
ncbi:MAG: Teichoic acid translocation permease protein TagG [uncultured Sulfurovum sp.]|uniref:Transport permease protein n=1 Tax=uncultured Sulfurovum sp. TaxID=269237 RepID=A0A6S6TPD9_9BACT|nr:MAG: Teichoic acid translocation permease protein TagG [uncultured Sulfurovum sp.]